jgi:hypothetical protein
MPIPTKPGDVATVDPQEASGAPALGLSQKQLKALIERRHPEYAEKQSHWSFLEDTYEGGREWFKDNIFQYVKEGPQEYADRVQRAYRFNHTREVVDLINKYLFRQNIVRREDDAPESVKAFWKKSTRAGLGIKDFARQVSKAASIYGRVGVVIDNPTKEAPLTKADEKKAGIAPYAYIVGPQQLLDYAYDEHGNLEWILILETKRDDDNPFTSSGAESFAYRLWTKYDWRLFEVKRDKNKKPIVVETESGIHNLGAVPVILVDHIISDEPYCASAMIDDIAYLDRAVANYLSNLDAIIQDQTFSQLAMPAQNMMPGDVNYEKTKEMGTKRVFLYDGEGGAKPEYLSPDVKQAKLIVEVIVKIISEIYHTIGLAAERTQTDNTAGATGESSGVAKAFDFERVNALLAAKADALEVTENRIVRLVALWTGEERAIEKLKRDLVLYPDDFDTRGLYDEFDIAARLMLVSAPDGIRRQQMQAVTDKLFPQLGEAERAKLLAELKSWPPELPDLAAPSGKSAANAASGQTRQIKEDAKNPKKAGQGSVQD